MSSKKFVLNLQKALSTETPDYNVNLDRNILIKGEYFSLKKTALMAIINVTPDSFFSLSRIQSETKLINSISKAYSDGANLIDLGGCSTRPDVKLADESEEELRIRFALKIINREFPKAIVSLDTFRPRIAQVAAEEYGISIINDISGAKEPNMIETVAKLNLPYILTHSLGLSALDGKLPEEERATPHLLKFFGEKIYALRNNGFTGDIILDPGFGFAKNLQQNYEILNNLELFQEFNLPILVGISRKTMIWRPLESSPIEALNGTTVLNTISLLKGANILRVHDVKEAREAITLVEQLNTYK